MYDRNTIEKMVGKGEDMFSGEKAFPLGCSSSSNCAVEAMQHSITIYPTRSLRLLAQRQPSMAILPVQAHVL